MIAMLTPASPSPAQSTFVQVLPSEPSSLDPAKTLRVHDDQVMWPMYDALTLMSADGTTMLPALAERWSRSEDGLTYTFTLRRDVQFHDGSKLTAEAVKASYERQYLRGSPYYTATPPNAYEKVLAGFVKEVTVLGSHVVAIKTHYARPTQFAIVKIVSLQALDRHKGDLSRSPVGSGPFKLEKWEGSEVILAPFAQSWHGKPRLDFLRFTVQADDAEQLTRLSSGQSHLFTHVPPDHFEQLRSNPNVVLVRYGGLNVMFLGMNLEQPALRDRRVREAIVRAIDRERIATVLGRGAMIAAKGPLPPACAGFEPSASQPAYDPEHARGLLREAGKATGFRLRLLYFSPLEIWSEIVHAVQADLQKVGITLELMRTASWNDFYAERKKGSHDLYFRHWTISAPEPERILFPLFHSESQDNFSHLNNARIDKLLVDARQPMDDPRRLQLHREATRLVIAEMPAIFLVHRIGVAGVNSRVKGLTLNLYGHPQDKLATVKIE
jgi:peptide/nickel transport system substrate-binding protein